MKNLCRINPGKLATPGGIGAGYQFNKYLGLYGEGLVVSKGAKATITEQSSGGILGGGSTSSYEEIYRVLYAVVALALKVSYGFDNFYLKAFSGPSLNFNLAGTYSTENKGGITGDIENEKINGIKLLETGFVYGAGFDILTKNDDLFSWDFPFNRALTSFAPLAAGKNPKTQYSSIGVGYAFKSEKK
jgi:hypothetical protein